MSDPLSSTIARMYPTLSQDPVIAAFLIRCERRLQEIRPTVASERDSEVTRTLAPVVVR